MFIRAQLSSTCKSRRMHKSRYIRIRWSYAVLNTKKPKPPSVKGMDFTNWIFNRRGYAKKGYINDSIYINLKKKRTRLCVRNQNSGSLWDVTMGDVKRDQVTVCFLVSFNYMAMIQFLKTYPAICLLYTHFHECIFTTIRWCTANTASV